MSLFRMDPPNPYRSQILAYLVHPDVRLKRKKSRINIPAINRWSIFCRRVKADQFNLLTILVAKTGANISK